MKRRLLLTGALLAPCTRAAIQAPQVQRQTRALMGTQVRLVVPGPAEDLRPALDAAWAEMSRLERLYSRFRADSLVSRLARQAGAAPLAMPPLMRELLGLGRGLAQRSQGAFDATVGAYRDWHFGPLDGRAPEVPDRQKLAAQRALVNWREIEVDGGQVRLARAGMRLDLGALAKLPILEAGLQQLRQHGVRDALIDGGGDILAIGQLHGRPWRVGVRDPREPDSLLAQLTLQDRWLVSSGDYERCFVHEGRRYHHVLDPRSGLPSHGLRGVSLLGRDWRALAGLGTTLMVTGAGAWSALRTQGVEGLWVDEHQVGRSRGFDDALRS